MPQGAAPLAVSLGLGGVFRGVMLNFKEVEETVKFAGMMLANQLVQRTKLQHRTVSLVAFSLGIDVVLACLEYLEERNDYGIVHNVYLIGGGEQSLDETLKREPAYRMASGRLVNCFSKTEFVLKYVYNKMLQKNSYKGNTVS